MNATGQIATDGTMPCALANHLPVLNFIIDGINYSLEPEWYVLKGQTTADTTTTVEMSAVECQLGIQGSSPLLAGELW